MPIVSDCHMHTIHSGDSATPMEEMILQGISQGLTTICFTEHNDYGFPITDALRVPLGYEQEYVRSILKFPEEYEMPCYIAIGKPKDDAVYNEQKKYAIENRIHLNEW